MPDDIPEKTAIARATDTQSLVRRLLTHETGKGQDEESLLEAAERVTTKLRAHLSKRIGTEGFRTLLVRALTLATVQFPHLISVQVGADGSLVGLRGTPGHGMQKDSIEGAAALVAHLLQLLDNLIGEYLTLLILDSVWPELALHDAAERETESP